MDEQTIDQDLKKSDTNIWDFIEKIDKKIIKHRSELKHLMHERKILYKELDTKED